MTDKRINIIIDSRQAVDSSKKIDRNVKEIGKSADNSQFKLNRLALAIKAAIVGGALSKAVGVLVQAQREFDRLNASLITATGSAELAAGAFADIERLAATTPYSVEQVTEAFIKLRNLGLDPSEEAIISYGNTAAAMGKDLSQLIEAVADATTGEFERLKEFGIKARNEGEQIALTFQGTTERIANNAQAIEQYLQSLGNEQFAGAINARLQTLDGAVSNLGDAWGTLVRAVGASGLSDSIEDAVRLATEGIQELTGAIRSGQLQQAFGAWTSGFEGFAEDFTGLMNATLAVYRDFTEQIGASSGSISGFLSSAFVDAGPNIRAFIQLMTVEVAGAIERVVAYASYLKTAISDFGFGEASAQLEADLARINSIRTSSIETIVSEAEAVKQSTAVQIEAARQLRLEYERSNTGGGGLGQFQIQGEGDQGGNKKADKFAADLAAGTASLQRELELRRNISQIYRQGELDATASQFEQERALQQINEQTRLAELQARYEEDVARRQFQFSAKLENMILEEQQRRALESEFREQEILLRQSFEEEKSAIELEGAKNRNAIAKAEMQSRLSNAQSLGNSLISLGKGQSKTIFGIGQKLAMAQAAAALPSAVIQSFQNGGGYPWGLVPAGAMLATGLKNINDIRKAGSGLGASSAGSAPSISLPSSASSSSPSASQTVSGIQPNQARNQDTILSVPRYDDDEPVPGSWVNRLMDQINEQQRNGKVLLRGEL